MITKLFKSLIAKTNPGIWQFNMGPHHVADQQAIEGVQRRATKLIISISHCPYPEILRILLNLPSLNYWRLRGYMIFLYQITHHNSDTSLIDLFQRALTTCTRGHNIKYFKPRCKTHHRCNFFSYRTIDN